MIYFPEEFLRQLFSQPFHHLISFICGDYKGGTLINCLTCGAGLLWRFAIVGRKIKNMYFLFGYKTVQNLFPIIASLRNLTASSFSR